MGDLAGGVVEGEEIAGAGIDHQALILSGVAEGRRKLPDLYIGKLAQPAAVAIDGVGVHGRDFLVGILLPLEENPAAIVRPAGAAGFVAHQRGSAHDVIDRQGEVIRRPGLQDE